MNKQVEKCKEKYLKWVKEAKEYSGNKNSKEYGLLLGKIEGIEFTLMVLGYFIPYENT